MGNFHLIKYIVPTWQYRKIKWLVTSPKKHAGKDKSDKCQMINIQFNHDK